MNEQKPIIVPEEIEIFQQLAVSELFNQLNK